MWYNFREIYTLEHKLLFKNYKNAYYGPPFWPLNYWNHNPQNQSQPSLSGIEPSVKIYRYQFTKTKVIVRKLNVSSDDDDTDDDDADDDDAMIALYDAKFCGRIKRAFT